MDNKQNLKISMPSISAIIITYNEEKKISDCLEALIWTDEIIVVDSGSTDRTRELAMKYTSFVYNMDWLGYGPQKNRALSLATSEWILSIDADEIVSDSLKNEILASISHNTTTSYELPRLTTYCGKFLHHGGWWPDYTLRLFKRELGKFSNNQVHERLLIDGRTKRFTHPILHYRSDALEDTLNRMNKYSTLWAEEHQHKKTGGVFVGLTHAFWHFIKTYLLRMGFLDGREGFLMAISSSIGSFYKYTKLYYLNNEPKTDQ